MGNHKYIPQWKYYFFEKNKDIGQNTYNFITKEAKKNNFKILIIFYSGLDCFTYQDLLQFYDEKTSIYHRHVLILTNINEKFVLPDLKKIKTNLIKNIEKNEDLEQMIYIIEITSFYNQLGDEVGFPKKFIDKKLIEKDSELTIKDVFTFNILLCGRPGVGKSTLINLLLKKEKCYNGIGESLTNRIVKYIHDKYPIHIYDTPGFENKTNIENIKTLIKQKNETMHEENNRIHCVLYLMNKQAERTFLDGEKELILFLLEQNIEIFFIVTHSGKKEEALDFIEAAKLGLQQGNELKNKIEELKNNIYSVELIGDSKYGLKDIFNVLYNKFEHNKCNTEITKSNIEKINSPFLKEINSKVKIQKRLRALAERVRLNGELLASTIGNFGQGSTMLSVSVIRLISNIYNSPMNIEQCEKYIEKCGYTNEINNQDSGKRKIEKIFALLHKNGPAAKEVNYISKELINSYNKEIMNDDKFYKCLNIYREGINFAIDSLKNLIE